MNKETRREFKELLEFVLRVRKNSFNNSALDAIQAYVEYKAGGSKA